MNSIRCSAVLDVTDQRIDDMKPALIRESSWHGMARGIIVLWIISHHWNLRAAADSVTRIDDRPAGSL